MQHGGLHHLHVRKRTYKHLSPYPHPVAWKRAYDHLMYVVAIFSPLALVPQIADIYTLKDAGALSLYTWVTLVALNVLWTTYGFIHGDRPIFLSSAIAGVLNLVLVYGIVIYS